MGNGKIYVWQEIMVNSNPCCARQFRITAAHSRVWKHQWAIVLVENGSFKIYQQVASLADFVPRRDNLLGEIADKGGALHALQQYFAPAAIKAILACRDHLRGVLLQRQGAWHFIVTARQEIVIARDIELEKTWMGLNGIAIVVHRNSVSLHRTPLLTESPPSFLSCFKTFPSSSLRRALAEFFTPVIAAEIAAVHHLNRDALLRCLRGGKGGSKDRDRSISQEGK